MPDWDKRASSVTTLGSKVSKVASSGKKAMVQTKINWPKKTPSPDSRAPAPLNKKPRMVEEDDRNQNASNREEHIVIDNTDAKAGEDDFDDKEVQKGPDTHGKDDTRVLSNDRDAEKDAEKPAELNSSGPEMVVSTRQPRPNSRATVPLNQSDENQNEKSARKEEGDAAIAANTEKHDSDHKGVKKGGGHRRDDSTEVGENDVGKTKVDNRHVPPRVSLRPKRSTKMATASQLYGDFISQDDSDYEEQGDEPQWTENRRNNRRRRFQDRSALEATCSSEDVVKDRSAVLERRQEKEKQDAAFAHQTAANKDQMELTALAKVSNIFLLHVVTSLFHRASSFLGSWSSSCRL